MAIIGSQVAYVTLKYDLAGVNAQNTFPYAPDDDLDTVTAQAVAEAFESSILPSFEAAVSAAVSFTMISVETKSPLGSTNYDLALAGSNGARTAESLPPNAAWGFYKLPDNANIEGSNQNNFKQGAFRVMGVAEEDQRQGIAVSGAEPLLQDIADNILHITVDPLGSNVGMTLFMFREPLTPTGPPASAAFVTSVGWRNTVRHQDTRQRY